jgi:RNA recognition motif-containing protein
MTDLDSGMVEDELNFSYSSKREATPEHPTPTGIPSDKLYVGHLPFDVSKREMDDLFGHYGTLVNIEIKHGGFAFVQYDTSLAAENAVEALHNYLFEGKRLTVEFSNKKGAGGDSCLLCGLRNLT